MAEDWLEVYETCADRLSNNLRLNEISLLSFFQFYRKINRNQLEIVANGTYGLHSNKYFEILNLTFWGRSLLMRHFGLHSNSRGADEIKGLPVSIGFCNRNTELLLLFSIISPWWKGRVFFDQQNYIKKSTWKRCGFFDYWNYVKKTTREQRWFLDQPNYIEKVSGNKVENRQNLALDVSA